MEEEVHEDVAAQTTPGGQKRPPGDLEQKSPVKTRREDAEPSNADLLACMTSMFAKSDATSERMYAQLTSTADRSDDRTSISGAKLDGVEFVGGERADEAVRSRLAKLAALRSMQLLTSRRAPKLWQCCRRNRRKNHESDSAMVRHSSQRGDDTPMGCCVAFRGEDGLVTSPGYQPESHNMWIYEAIYRRDATDRETMRAMSWTESDPTTTQGAYVGLNTRRGGDPL